MITHPQHGFTAHPVEPGTQQVLSERLAVDMTLMPPGSPGSPLKPSSQGLLYGFLHRPALEGMGQRGLPPILQQSGWSQRMLLTAGDNSLVKCEHTAWSSSGASSEQLGTIPAPLSVSCEASLTQFPIYETGFSLPGEAPSRSRKQFRGK